MTNQQIREWYIERVSKIPELNKKWLKEGLSIESRARRAWQLRHEARLKARAMMQNSQEVTLLQERDLGLYGDPGGPTFEFLLKEAGRQGLKGDKIYQAIIDGSFKTNAEIDKRFR